MKYKLRVVEQIPLPARNLANMVQSVVGKHQKAVTIIHDGGVSVNGRLCVQPHTKLKVGDTVVVDYIEQPVVTKSSRKSNSKSPREVMQVVYEDEWLIVVNKPADLLTVPTLKRESRTLIGEVSRYIDRQSKNEAILAKGKASRTSSGKAARPKSSKDNDRHKPMYSAFCVHRLDRGVSGLLVFAKDLETCEQLRSQFAERKPNRKYIAVVSGTLMQSKGTFRSRLATDDQLNQYSTTDESAQLAITHFSVRKKLRNATIVEVKLETGRRNQIRVHFAEAGHPIFGDNRYGQSTLDNAIWPHRRIALHAESLGFTHPRSNETLEFVSEWPHEIRAIQRREH